jgi:hypothetical protein
MEEVDDVDRHPPRSNLKLSDPILMGSEELRPHPAKRRPVQIEEEDDVDRHRPGSGLKSSGPLLMESEEIHHTQEAELESNDEEPEEMVEFLQEFTWEHYPEGPRCEEVEDIPTPPVTAVPTKEQLDDISELVFVICDGLAIEGKAKGPLVKANIPRL